MVGQFDQFNKVWMFLAPAYDRRRIESFEKLPRVRPIP